MFQNYTHNYNSEFLNIGLAGLTILLEPVTIMSKYNCHLNDKEY
jgi:hypothetical protein